jgi:hypothetical protein
MARKFFVLGVFVMAGAFGVLGYQCLTYYFYGTWPAVSLGFVWGELFGDFPVLDWTWANYLLLWIGKLPIVGLGIVLSYIILLVSDSLRGRNTRQSR